MYVCVVCITGDGFFFFFFFSSSSLGQERKNFSLLSGMISTYSGRGGVCMIVDAGVQIAISLPAGILLHGFLAPLAKCMCC
jgi:hypothetical protein